MELKWTPGNRDCGATSGHDGNTCSRCSSVGAYC